MIPASVQVRPPLQAPVAQLPPDPSQPVRPQARIPSSVSPTSKPVLPPGARVSPKATEPSGWPLGALPTAGQTARKKEED